MKLTDYPLSQYSKNGKVDLQKVVNNSSQLSDHILVHMLIYVCTDLQKQISQLKKLAKKENGGQDGDQNQNSIPPGGNLPE